MIALPSQLWRELKWWSIGVTILTAYALFALAEVGLEIENVFTPSVADWYGAVEANLPKAMGRRPE